VRNSDEKQQMIQYLRKVHFFQGLDYEMYLQLTDSFTAVKMLANSFLFRYNQIPDYMHIFYEGKIMTEDPFKFYQPGEFIEKEYLEDETLRVKTTYVVGEGTIVFSLQRKGFNQVLKHFLSSYIIVLKDNMLG
jgi:hypothetical protein